MGILLVVVIVATVQCTGCSEGSGDSAGGCESGHCTLYRLDEESRESFSGCEQVGISGVGILLVVVIVATVHCTGWSEGSGYSAGGCDSGHCTLYRLE